MRIHRLRAEILRTTAPSFGDVNAHYASAQQAQIMFLNEYIYGRV